MQTSLKLEPDSKPLSIVHRRELPLVQTAGDLDTAARSHSSTVVPMIHYNELIAARSTRVSRTAALTALWCFD